MGTDLTSSFKLGWPYLSGGAAHRAHQGGLLHPPENQGKSGLRLPVAIHKLETDNNTYNNKTTNISYKWPDLDQILKLGFCSQQ